jgi:hypothetical protein
MVLPGIAIGYDGQGYMHKPDATDRYFQEPRGIYLLIGREAFAEGVFMNLGINSNTFKDGEVYGFVSLTIPLGTENFLFMAEYDNINYMPESRLNFGFRIQMSEDVSIDITIRDCWGSKDDTLYPNDRMVSLNYTGQF